MEDLFEIVFCLGIMIGFSLLVAQMSKERDIGFWTLFAISVIATPIVALIVGLIAKKRRNPNEVVVEQVSDNDSQKSFLSKFMKKKDDKSKEDLEMPNFDKPADSGGV